MKWITRRNVKVDRVACPWLISRFVDREARFLFVDEGELLEAARREEAVPFDAPRIPEVKLNHRGEHCSFEAILADFKLQDSALHRMALIIRAADIRGQEGIAAEGRGCVCWRRVSARWVCPMNNAWHCNFRCMTHCMHSLKKKGLRIMEPRKLEGLDCKRYTKKGVAWLAAVILLAANIALAQNTSSPSEGVGRWKQVEEAMGRQPCPCWAGSTPPAPPLMISSRPPSCLHQQSAAASGAPVCWAMYQAPSSSRPAGRLGSMRAAGEARLRTR